MKPIYAHFEEGRHVASWWERFLLLFHRMHFVGDVETTLFHVKIMRNRMYIVREERLR